MLSRVGLADRVDSLPSQLSGGEQQRVAVARALIRSPRCILADEPTGSLDPSTGSEVLSLLLDLCRERGSVLVIATHDDAIAARAARRVTLIDGQLQPS